MENKDTPLVSVIMIFLNAERFIEEAIASVLSQTYANWELIFVDDGSTDSSTAIAQRYAQQYPQKMRYVEHPGHQNRGMSASRNLGVQKSSGDYTALLDADDVYLAHKLEQQVALLIAQPDIAMVYDAAQYWYSWTGEADDMTRDRLRTLGVQADRSYHPPELFVRFLQNTARTPGTCSVLIRRNAFESAGGFEERFPGMFEDQVFFYKLCLHQPVYVHSGYSSRYRQHPDSHCYVSLQNGVWDPGHQQTRTRIMFLEWLENYINGQKVSDPRILDALRKELWSYRYPKLSHLLFSAYRAMGMLRTRIRHLL